MSYRLKLSVLTMIAGFAFAIPGCGDDADGDEGGGDAGDGPSATGGKASTGGSTGKGGSSTDGGSDSSDAGSPSSSGGAPGEEGGAPGDAGGAPSDVGGAPSDAGSTSTGGTSTGGTSTGGTSTGGTGGGTCEAPACLIELQGECAPEGACTSKADIDLNTGDFSYALCWANGVKAGFTDFDIETSSGTMVFQKDGDPCYSLELQVEDTGSSGTTTGTYRNVDGETVATMTVDNETETQTIVCIGGDTYVYSPGSCEDEAPATPDQSECTMGACSLD